MDPPDSPASFFVQAEYPFTSKDALSFAPGDVIEVLTQLESGWWDGLLVTGQRGWFPSNYVRRITDAEAEAWFVRQEEVEGDERGEEEEEGLFFDPGGDAGAQERPISGDHGRSEQEQGVVDVADFWIPSMTEDGQVSTPWGPLTFSSDAW